MGCKDVIVKCSCIGYFLILFWYCGFFNVSFEVGYLNVNFFVVYFNFFVWVIGMDGEKDIGVNISWIGCF